MEHNGKKSRCIVCAKNFDGKRGAQSHSSKIHNMTLDGRLLDHDIKKKPKLDINENFDSKEIPPVNNNSNKDEKFLQTITHADKMINLNSKINQLENMGLMKQAYEIREKYNLFKTKSDKKPQKSIDDKTKNTLLMMWNNEDDPVRRDIIYNIILMKYSGASDDVINMGLIQLMNTPVTQKPEKSEFEKQLELEIVKQSIKNMNHDPFDDFIRYKMSTSKKSNEIDELGKYIEKSKQSKITPVEKYSNKGTRKILKTTKYYKVPAKIQSVRKVLPIQTSVFHKNSYDGYFEFDESVNNADSNG